MFPTKPTPSHLSCFRGLSHSQLSLSHRVYVVSQSTILFALVLKQDMSLTTPTPTLCTHWLKTGTCRFGSGCMFMHFRPTALQMEDICTHWMKRTCRFDPCRHFHPAVGDDVCRFALIGACRYGETCNKHHIDLRPVSSFTPPASSSSSSSHISNPSKSTTLCCSMEANTEVVILFRTQGGSSPCCLSDLTSLLTLDMSVSLFFLAHTDSAHSVSLTAPLCAHSVCCYSSCC